MISPEYFIDSVQNAKRTFTNTVIKDATLNKAANDYIDAQTAFAKMLAQNTLSLTTYAANAVSKVLFPQKG